MVERASPPSTDPAGSPELIESAHWRSLLSGEDQAMRRLRATWRRVPHGPRCKVCSAPFAGIGGVATRVILHGRSIANPTMCTTCFKALADHPGGTELEISVVFADIRGSTAIAETIGAVAFRGALQTFYGLGAEAIEGHGGFVDKYLGDGVMALFIPILAGEGHAGHGFLEFLFESVQRRLTFLGKAGAENQEQRGQRKPMSRNHLPSLLEVAESGGSPAALQRVRTAMTA